MKKRPDPARVFAGVIVLGLGLFCAYLLLRGFWTLGASIIDWAKHGAWRHPTIAAELAALGLPHLKLEWVGLDRVLQWVLGLPGAVGLFLAAWGLGKITQQIVDEIERDDVTSAG